MSFQTALASSQRHLNSAHFFHRRCLAMTQRRALFPFAAGAVAMPAGMAQLVPPRTQPNLQLFSRDEPCLRYRCLLPAISSRSQSRRRAAGGR
jgi:hypothetical protein